MSGSTIRSLTTRAGLLAASGGDAFVRWEVADAPVQGWALGDGAVAFVRTAPSGRRHLTLVGTPDAAVRGLRAHLDGPPVDVPAVRSVTVPLGTLELLGPDPRIGSGDDWEWMWTASAPPEHPDVVPLASADHDDIAALLAASSPRHTARADDHVVAWMGVRRGGRLVACGAHLEHVPGAAHLASIATHPEARGSGLGAAVTGTLAARALRSGRAVVTLGMYSDNDAARRVYLRLGFRCDHRWSSRRILAQ